MTDESTPRSGSEPWDVVGAWEEIPRDIAAENEMKCDGLVILRVGPSYQDVTALCDKHHAHAESIYVVERQEGRPTRTRMRRYLGIRFNSRARLRSAQEMIDVLRERGHPAERGETDDTWAARVGLSTNSNETTREYARRCTRWMAIRRATPVAHALATRIQQGNIPGFKPERGRGQQMELTDEESYERINGLKRQVQTITAEEEFER